MLLTKSIHELISDLEKARFFGTVEAKFQAGKVVMFRRTETYIAKNHNGGNQNQERGSYDEQQRDK